MQMYDIILQFFGFCLHYSCDKGLQTIPTIYTPPASMESPWDENPRFSSEAEWSKISTEFTNVRYFSNWLKFIDAFKILDRISRRDYIRERVCPPRGI